MQRFQLDPNGRAGTAASALILAACSASPVSVDDSALQVRATVSPAVIAAPAAPAGDSVRVLVSVTNPDARPVVVQLGGPPYRSGNIPAAETSGIGFGVRVLGADSARQGGPSEWTWGQPTVALGARATLRHTFFIRVGAQSGAGLRVPPGTYRVVASFGRQEAAPAELRVLP